MLSTSNLIAFLATTNPDRSKSFYRDILGLKFITHEEFAVVFDVNGIILRIAIVDNLTPQPFTVLSFKVENIEKKVKELNRKNIKVEIYEHFNQNDLGIMEFEGGAKVAWFKDPDGNLISLTENST